MCRQLGNVPLHVVPLTKEYWDLVVADCIQQVRQGLTPNPDVLCNARQVPHRVLLSLWAWCGAGLYESVRRIVDMPNSMVEGLPSRFPSKSPFDGASSAGLRPRKSFRSTIHAQDKIRGILRPRCDAASGV